MDREAHLAVWFADDFDADRVGCCDTRPLIARIGGSELHERLPRTGGAHQRPGSVSVLNVAGVGLEFEHRAVRLDHGVALATLDLLAGIVAADASALGRLDALAVDHSRRRARFLARPPAVAHDQVVVDRLPSAVFQQLGEPAIDRTQGRKRVGHQPPCDAAAQHVADGVHHFALRAAETDRGLPTRHRSGRFHSVARNGYLAHA